MHKTIGVFFGGKSPEHDVSIITGEFIIAELKKLGYPVVAIYIGKAGEWYLAEELGSFKFFTKNNTAEKLEKNNWREFNLDLKNSHGKLVFKKKGIMGKTQTVDVAFPALHGSFGEDGTIQGLFEMFNVPYVGCGVTASAAAMDKVLTKDIYSVHQIATAPYLGFSAREWKENKITILGKIRSRLSKAAFVKPARLGSSIGISKVKDTSADDLELKIEVALHYDSLVIVENAVENAVDLTCCIIGNTELIASLVQESVFSSDLFDFNEKYLDDGGAQLGNAQKRLVIPANIPPEVAKKIQEQSKSIFTMFGASGVARVDWLYNRESGELFANEINPLPGTLYHHLWKASGVEIGEVLERLVVLALERHKQRQQQTYTFESSVLQQAGLMKLPGKKL